MNTKSTISQKLEKVSWTKESVSEHCASLKKKIWFFLDKWLQNSTTFFLNIVFFLKSSETYANYIWLLAVENKILYIFLIWQWWMVFSRYMCRKTELNAYLYLYKIKRKNKEFMFRIERKVGKVYRSNVLIHMVMWDEVNIR